MTVYPLSLQADEMLARQLDTGFTGAVRGLVTDPADGSRREDPESALAGIAETIPLLSKLKDRYLSQAIVPRQKALLEPLSTAVLTRSAATAAECMVRRHSFAVNVRTPYVVVSLRGLSRGQ